MSVKMMLIIALSMVMFVLKFTIGYAQVVVVSTGRR